MRLGCQTIIPDTSWLTLFFVPSWVLIDNFIHRLGAALGQTFLHLSKTFFQSSFQLCSCILESLGYLEYLFELADDLIDKGLFIVSKDCIHLYFYLFFIRLAPSLTLDHSSFGSCIFREISLLFSSYLSRLFKVSWHSIDSFKCSSTF